MKAKEYATQVINDIPYITDIENVTKVIGILGHNFMVELQSMIKARNIGYNSNEQSLVNLVKEFNEKWKKTALLINTETEKKFGVPIVKYNGFINYFKTINSDAESLINRYSIS